MAAAKLGFTATCWLKPWLSADPDRRAVWGGAKSCNTRPIVAVVASLTVRIPSFAGNALTDRINLQYDQRPSRRDSCQKQANSPTKTTKLTLDFWQSRLFNASFSFSKGLVGKFL